MTSKVREKKSNKQAINNVAVTIDYAEKAYLNAFFAMVGMTAAFLEANTNHRRRHINYALSSGSFKFGLLTDVRAFVKGNIAQVAEFMPQDLKNPYDGK